ncbi:hypothetical protein [Burkholderia lata]|uniref:Transmembrane protein n=1 Tax=Burkholderia lata (strain ATCC 17760 / DSM 23089 / LMG 22485 / NCIMB 9086 / R18194 / 383) TaxID=482957 RepID=A0A6P2TT08_BURL3|nr:hypothetical protein [Burkholderia lata]VWC60277.1 hypothetical protein BLA18109_01459 [Burkholderia lata]
MPPLIEAILGWATVVLGALGLLTVTISVLAPDRWMFDAGYGCVRDGQDLVLSPRRMRINRFVWWLLGFGFGTTGLACLVGAPAFVGILTGDELHRWYEWLGLVLTVALIVGLGVLMIWIGSKLMRSRWFGGPLRETRFCWRDGERWIDITTTRLLRRPVRHTYACRDLEHVLIGARRSLDGAVVAGSRVALTQGLVQLVLVFRGHPPIDMMGRIKDGTGVHRMIDMIGTWCGVEAQRVEGLPDVTPFNFDRI